ncbi:HEPN domain-containing protein [Cobetia sp. QF-1]|uniref:HEPN domain-containing protein n=1 Tax=Cobetia sp. QF-1 TaxID=1969833 RepID=UPI000B5441AF|nr:HEPN domain-containing protein [Cobetia sp. QF-1]
MGVDKNGWFLATPLDGIEFCADFFANFIRVDSIYIVSGEYLLDFIKQRGLELDDEAVEHLQHSVENDSVFYKAYAVWMSGGNAKEKTATFHRKVLESLNILMLSQMTYKTRNLYGLPRPYNSNYGFHYSSVTCLGRDGTSYSAMEAVGKPFSLKIDDDWVRNCREGFFDSLLKVINGKSEVSENWRWNIYQAASLSGESQASSNMRNAFIWNWIAIESMLLTKETKDHKGEITKRIDALMEWAYGIIEFNMHEEISEAYSKRCAFIHDGKGGDIDIKDLELTDVIIMNLLNTICSHAELFSCQEKIYEFSEVMAAERLLKKSSMRRPDSFTFINFEGVGDSYLR